MVEAVESRRLNAAIAALRQYGVIPKVAAALSADLDRACDALLNSVLREAPAFKAAGNPDVIPELSSHLLLQLKAVCQLMAGQALDDLAFVREHASRRAEQKFPLDAVLAAYRCLHKSLIGWLRDAALRVADADAQVTRVVAAINELTIEYTGTIGTLMTSEYVLQTRALAEAEGDRKTELLSTLLNGYDESDPHATQLLGRAGYLEQHQSFCVALARSVDPQEMDSAACAQRMADSIAGVLGKLPIRVLIGVRDNLVTVVLSDNKQQSGSTEPRSQLEARVYPQLQTVGTAMLIGVSSGVASTAHIPAALNEAKLALDFSDVDERVMLFTRIPFRNMLVGVAAGRMQSAIPAWMDNFLSADTKAKGALVATLRTYADADMNAQKTAKTLNLHPNTIYARMQRIQDMTARNPLSFNDLNELLLAIDCSMRNQHEISGTLVRS
jgi:hypothetical protein